MEFTFIVNGTETTVSADPSDTLRQVATIALEQASYHRHLDDFQAIRDDKWLGFEKRMSDHELLPDSVIFLSLKAGQGA